MPAAQHLLFPDPRPLVERLGREFFRGLPTQPGVYLMRDGADNVLYVGKARNLRKRLTSYRVANPDRLSRRHLRLLGSVVRVELQLCADEAAALRREAELILSLKPRYNRAGTWAPPPRYLTWRVECRQVLIGLVENAGKEERAYGPLRGNGRWVKAALVRLLWFALNPSSNLGQMPAGWCHARFPEPVILVCNEPGEDVKSALDELTRGNIGAFCSWVRARRGAGFTRVFDEVAFEGDLETLQRAWAKRMCEPIVHAAEDPVISEGEAGRGWTCQ